MPSDPNGVIETLEDGKSMISFERHIPHPIERVWAAITEPSEMIGWWGDAKVDLREGGEFTVSWLNVDKLGQKAVMESRIDRLDPPRLLETSGGLHGSLRWELEPEDGGTRLRFTSTTELPDEYRTMVIAGWHTHLDAMVDALEGREVDLVNIEERWEPVHQRYVAQLA